MILISAGHTPSKPGACFDEFCENPEAIVWVYYVLKEFEELDIAAMEVPNKSLTEKVDFINKQNATAAIEIHFNSAVDGNGKHVGLGSETLYCPGSKNGKILANSVQKYISALFAPSRGIKEGWHRMDKPGAVDYPGDIDGDEKPDYFLKYTNCPAIIIEPEFIHHRTQIVQRRISGSKSITHGIIEGIEGFKNDSKKSDSEKESSN